LSTPWIFPSSAWVSATVLGAGVMESGTKPPSSNAAIGGSDRLVAKTTTNEAGGRDQQMPPGDESMSDHKLDFDDAFED
jgi:hypothetical protein